MDYDHGNDTDKDIGIKKKTENINEVDQQITKRMLDTVSQRNIFEKFIFIGSILLAALGAIIVQYIYSNYYLLPLQERSLFEPLNKLEIDTKLWGQYCPQSIFSLRTCHPNTLQFGISWYDNTTEVVELRHYVSDIVSLQTLIGDGKSFGHHVVLDEFGNVTIHWVSINEYWNARISVNRDPFQYETTTGFILYLYSWGKSQSITVSEHLSNVFSGSNSLFGNYTLSIYNVDSVDADMSIMASNVEHPNNIPSTIKNAIEKQNGKSRFQSRERQGSLVAVQFVFQSNFKAEVKFFNELSKSLVANNFDELYEVKVTAFTEKFENVFKLREMGMPEIYQTMGVTALSNLLNSASYYYGNLEAVGYYNPHFDLKNIELFSLPITRGSTRSSLDEQLFSLLTLFHFDRDIVKQTVRSWLGIMNKLGVLPIEHQQKILDFRIRQAPTIFYLIDKIFLENSEEAYLEEIYTKLEILARHSFEGLSSNEDVSFSWNFLSTYLADYSHSLNKEQYNVNFHCWMIIATRLMKKISTKYGTMEQKNYFEKWDDKVNNVDFHKMTESVVNGSFVYNFLYPMILKLLPENSLQLNIILERLEDPKTIWTPYGLRSLSQSLEFQNVTSNCSTYRDVFIPDNYLILGALKHYSEHSTKYQNLAHSLYYKLRNNLVVYVAREFKRTKMLWESYEDTTGKGRGRSPHNWSSIILLIMSEKF